jgi:Tfp pilus assembly protein PilF
MRASALPLLLLLAPSVACAARRGVEVQDAPIWSTEAGRESTRIQLAQAMLDAGSPEVALQMVGQLRAEGADGPDLDRLHAEALMAVGLSDDAEEVLRRLIRRDPRDASAQNTLGILLMDRRQPTEAAEAFRGAVRAAPREADYQNNLGFALLALGQAEAAVEPLRVALQLDSSRPLTRNNLGFALAMAGRDKEAWRVLRAGVAAADAHYHLGLAQAVRGDADAARASYEAALAADPAHTPARDALAQLLAPPPPEVPDVP